MNLESKILSTILTNQFSNTQKVYIAMTKWGLPQECKVSLINKKSNSVICHIERIEDKPHIDSEKSTWQKSNFFMIQALNKLGVEDSFFNLMKGIFIKYPQPTSCFIVKHLKFSIQDQAHFLVQVRHKCSYHFYSILYWRF